MRSSMWLLATTVLAVIGMTAEAWSKNPEPAKKSPGVALEIPQIDGDQRFPLVEWEALRAPTNRAGSAEPGEPLRIERGAASYAVVNLEFDDAKHCQALQVPGVDILTRFDRFADVFIATTDIKAVRAVIAAPGFRMAEIAVDEIFPPPPRPRQTVETSKGKPEAIVHGGVKGLTGKGVTIAVIDSGIDFHHPDFIRYDAAGRPTSRVAYFWDTVGDAHTDGKFGSPAPVSYPNGEPIGVVYSRDELTAELRSDRGHPARISEWDTDGHGTACAGIAAGNGNAAKGKYSGVAPDADIIAVRIGGHGRPGQNENAYLVGAICGWLDKIVGNKPLVVSCSFGGQFGGHDGYRVEERQLDARFAEDRPGRAICISAGNEGGRPIHAAFSVEGASSPGHVEWLALVPGRLELFLQTDVPKDVDLKPDDDTHVKLLKRIVHPLTHQVIVDLDIGAGRGGLSITSLAAHKYHADAYIYPVGRAGFVGGTSSADKLIGTPGTTANAITVGSYDWNDRFDRQHQLVSLVSASSHTAELMKIGQRSDYSSPGYRRLYPADKTVKPDIVAPGQWYTASAAENVAPFKWRDTTGYYQVFNGTSAATPYTAGVVALLLQKNPRLTTHDIKTLLQTCATADRFTGDVPNPDWGYGKLDYKAIVRMIARNGADK